MIKSLKIGIDLQSLLSKRLTDKTQNLSSYKAYKGSLGAITLFSEVFDLYLLNSYSNINTEEILKWLKVTDCERCFRHIIPVDEKLRDFYLQQNINITIASDNKIAEKVKDVSITYWIQEVHTKDILDGIQKVNLWKDLVRDITKYSASDDYDYQFNKDKSPKSTNN